MSSDSEVWEPIEDLFAGFMERNDAKMQAQLVDDCTIWDVFEPGLIRGLEERAQFHARDKAQSTARGPLSLNIRKFSHKRLGDTAYACYELDFSYEPPNAVAGTVRITDILVRRSGRWLIQHHHEGLAPEGVPPIDAEQGRLSRRPSIGSTLESVNRP